MCTIVYKKYSFDSKSLSTLGLVLFWLVLGLIVCFIGIKNTYAQVINSTFLGQNVNSTFGVSANSYKQGVSSITVDSSSTLNYLVVDICSSISNDFSITNISNQSGSVSLYKIYHNLGTCNTGNYGGALSKIYFKVNSWADAGNGNYGLIFNSRFNNNISYYGDNKILNIYTVNEFDNTSDIINNQTNELNNSINNSTNTITGSITDSQNNINSNIDNMEDAIIDSNKETQDVIKDQFNSCRPSINLAYDINYSAGKDDWWTLASVYSTNIEKGKIYTISIYLEVQSETKVYWNGSPGYIPSKSFNVSNGINRYSYTFEALKSGTNIGIVLSKYNTGDSILITPSKLQIEEGNIATNYEEPNSEICTNKLDEQNDKLNDLNNSLNNSNIDDSLGSASNFFDNFNTSDHGGLSGIITAPLVAINQMLNTSCSPMTTTFKGKELSLPCGYEFWNKMGPIQDFVNLVLGGLLCYQIIIKLYKLIEKIKNPEDDRLEVMDL